MTMPMPVSTVPEVPFQKIMAHAMTGMVKDILLRLQDAQKDFIPTEEDVKRIQDGNLSVKIRVRIDRDDVFVPPFLKKLANNKKSMYVDFILDSFFKQLEVGDHAFSVCLQFQVSDRVGAGTVWAKVVVPYSAIRHISLGENHLDLVPYYEDDLNKNGDKTDATEK